MGVEGYSRCPETDHIAGRLCRHPLQADTVTCGSISGETALLALSIEMLVHFWNTVICNMIRRSNL